MSNRILSHILNFQISYFQNTFFGFYPQLRIITSFESCKRKSSDLKKLFLPQININTILMGNLDNIPVVIIN